MKRMFYSLALRPACGFAHAHSGDSDAQGCNTNRKTDDYRCYGSKFSSAAATAQPSAPQQVHGAEMLGSNIIFR